MATQHCSVKEQGLGVGVGGREVDKRKLGQILKSFWHVIESAYRSAEQRKGGMASGQRITFPGPHF